MDIIYDFDNILYFKTEYNDYITILMEDDEYTLYLDNDNSFRYKASFNDEESLKEFIGEKYGYF